MSTNGRKKKRRWLWVTAVLVLVIAAGIGLRATLRTTPTIDPSRLVEIERGDIARSVVATGKIEPRAKVEVKSKASGIVKQLFVDYGEHVRTGQVLAELDKEELQARVREAKAILMAAEAAQQSAQAAYERNQVEAEAPDLPFLKSPAYGASKAGVLNLSRNIAQDFAMKGVRVNVICPGWTA